jgi:hypothetical protein
MYRLKELKMQKNLLSIKKQFEYRYLIRNVPGYNYFNKEGGKLLFAELVPNFSG